MTDLRPDGLPPQETPCATPRLAMRHSLWLHGAGLAGNTWHPLTNGLPLAQTPNLPGHGTAGLVHPPRVERFADELATLVPEGAILIGHSLGGMVALELAARLGRRISALVLVEAVPTVRDRLSGRVSAVLATALFARLPVSWFARLSSLGQSPATAAELRRQLAQTDRLRVAAALQAASQYDGRRHLPQINIPCLVIVGRKNRATHHGARLMIDAIPGAELAMLDGGHMLHTDAPGVLLRRIETFLAHHLPQP